MQGSHCKLNAHINGKLACLGSSQNFFYCLAGVANAMMLGWCSQCDGVSCAALTSRSILGPVLTSWGSWGVVLKGAVSDENFQVELEGPCLQIGHDEPRRARWNRSPLISFSDVHLPVSKLQATMRVSVESVAFNSFCGFGGWLKVRDLTALKSKSCIGRFIAISCFFIHNTQ